MKDVLEPAACTDNDRLGDSIKVLEKKANLMHKPFSSAPLGESTLADASNVRIQRQTDEKCLTSVASLPPPPVVLEGEAWTDWYELDKKVLPAFANKELQRRREITYIVVSSSMQKSYNERER